MTSRLDDGFSSMLPAAPTGCGVDGDWRNAALGFEGVSLWPRPGDVSGRGGGSGDEDDEDGEDDDDYEGDEEADCGLARARRIGRNGRRCTVDGYGTCSSCSSRRRRSGSSSSGSDNTHSSS